VTVSRVLLFVSSVSLVPLSRERSERATQTPKGPTSPRWSSGRHARGQDRASGAARLAA